MVYRPGLSSFRQVIQYELDPPNIYFNVICYLIGRMVDPGASSERIREEVFEEFTSNIESSDIDQEVSQVILSTVMSDDPPSDISEAMIGAISENDET